MTSVGCFVLKLAGERLRAVCVTKPPMVYGRQWEVSCLESWLPADFLMLLFEGLSEAEADHLLSMWCQNWKSKSMVFLKKDNIIVRYLNDKG